MNITSPLFHPRVTHWAIISSAAAQIAGLATALGGATGALTSVFGDKSPTYAGVLILIGILLTQVAGWGRSTLPAVDNSVKP